MSRAILHVIEDLKPESGGPTTVVVELARQQALSGHRVAVCCLQGPVTTEQRERLQRTFASAGVHWLNLGSQSSTSMSRAIESSIKEFQPELIHLHGVWGRLLRLGASASQNRELKYVISTHGMLHPDVLKHGRWKKWVYLTLFSRFLRGASEILALNEEERAAIAERFRRPSSVLANGIDAGEYQAATPVRFRNEHPELAKRSFALFVGRLHAIKGIDLLLRSFAEAGRRGLKSHLVIAGPDSGELAALKTLALELGVAESCHFVGPLYGESKLSALAACSMFVHRPRFEGFGLSVVEALATGRAVVTTRRCRLDGAEDAGALRIAEDSDEGFAGAMLEIERDSELSSALGSRGRSWAIANFDWVSVSQRADAVYQRALQETSRS